MAFLISNPQSIAEEGERIYLEKFKTRYEAESFGKFVAIDIDSEDAFIGNSSEEAIQRGRQAHPNGIFHLIRIGSKGAFSISRIVHYGRLGRVS